MTLLRKRRVQAESTSKRIIEQSRGRLLCVAVFFSLCFLAIGGKLMEMGIRPAEWMEQMQVSQERAPAALPSQEDDTGKIAPDIVAQAQTLPRRADIVDRNGLMLATSLGTTSLFANPREISNAEAAARALLTKLPSLKREKLMAAMKKNASFVWIKRHLTPRQQQEINSLGIPGLYFTPEEKRIYPHGGMLSHLLGYVGVDDKGLSGIEKFFDTRLRPTGYAEASPPLQLSIDLRLQHIVQDELAKGMREFDAIGATGIVMDLENGELLALANLPDFNPHNPAKSSEAQRFNRASLGLYEMGSTFKTFTTAMALDYGIVGMRDGYDITHPIRVASYTISDTHPERGWHSVPEIFAHSSNIGTVKMAMDVGKSRQQKFLRKLGLMAPVPIELPELANPSYPRQWRDISMMTIAYGHGMAVTPLHLVRAVATLVGDGKLKNLTLVKGGNQKAKEGERVAKEDTVRQVRRLLRLVVEHGTGSKANVAGYRVGGKTGTAEKVQGKGYNKFAKMALFISTFPVDDPRYVMLVMLDEPKPTKATFGFATGGWNAAPVAGRIIARMAPLYGIRPVFDAPGDDAEKFWVERDDKFSPTQPSPASGRGLVVLPPLAGGGRGGKHPQLSEGLHAISY